ncbi:MAG TPA: hypothetical protein VFG89_10560 [Coriobacteriia bacterium]|nr:hypothetical protein [Coriobacteriia bacterium]
MTRSSRWRATVILAIVLTVAASVSGCASSTKTASPPTSTKTSSGAKTSGDLDLKTYLDADSKSADFTLTSTTVNGGATEMTGTLQVDGRKFRYSVGQPGKPMHEVMSPDGEKAYFVYHDRKVCEPSVASVDRYLVEFSEPSDKSADDGVDEKTGATRVVYKIQKLDDLAGADNAWWTEDVVFLVKDGSVIGVLTHGNASDGGKPAEMRETRRMFSRLEAGVPIPAETFELPYPVQAASD